MAGPVQPQLTQCLCLPGSIRPPVDRCGLERLSALTPKDKGVDGRLTRRNSGPRIGWPPGFAGFCPAQVPFVSAMP